MLEVLGLTQLEERLYGCLVDLQKAGPRELAEASEVSLAAARSALASLGEKGLVNRAPGRTASFFPVPPDLALEILLLRRQQELDLARYGANQLAERFKSSLHRRSPTEGVELVTGREAIAQRFAQMETAAQEEILVLDRPPYAMDTSERNDAAFELLQRGVTLRTIYEREALDIAGRLKDIREEIEAGALARVMVSMPLKLVVTDRRLAMVPVSGGTTIEGAIVIHESSLLAALVVLFDVLWERADALFPLDVPGDSMSPLSMDDAEIVTLLALGMQDQAIARQVGVTVRTVVRRVRRVMDLLDARTRFEAGAKALDRGWIKGSRDQPPDGEP